MIDILNSAIETSTGEFSSPNEIKRFLEDVTGEQISTNRLSALLKELGFIHSRAYQRVGKTGIKSSFYHLKEDKKSRLHLKDSVLLDGIEPVKQSTLGEINYSYLKFRSEKEGSLASLRKIEASIAELKRDALALSNDIQSGEYLSIENTQKNLDLALVEMKSEFDNLALSISPRLVSMTNEDEIFRLIEGEVFRSLSKLAQIDITLPA